MGAAEFNAYRFTVKEINEDEKVIKVYYDGEAKPGETLERVADRMAKGLDRFDDCFCKTESGRTYRVFVTVQICEFDDELE